jgi:hypothetical protein
MRISHHDLIHCAKRYTKFSSLGCPLRVMDRDRGTPHGATPPTPPGIRVTYHGGSTGLSLGGDMESGETERVEVAIAQGLLDRRVS